MTVQREDMATFDTSKEKLIEHTRKILNKSSVYKNTTEEQVGSVFTTTVKPHWLLMGTKMIVQIDGTQDTSTAKASIVSQWFIMGDALSYYNRYIKEFLTSLRGEINK